METLVSTDGRKIKVRSYKDSEKQLQYDYTATFKRVYEPMSFERYGGSIEKDSFNKYSYFEFARERIYIDKALLQDTQGEKYSIILLSGLLSPKIIFCALDSLCRPQQDSVTKMITIGNTRTYSNTHEAFDSSSLIKHYNWAGIRISISDIAELPYLEKTHTKVFRFEHKIYYGGWSDAFFLFEITNDQATKRTTFSDFVKGARLTFIKHTWTGHEI